MDFHAKYPHFHLPYRGLPSEVRIIIWGYHFGQVIEIKGPFFSKVHEGARKGHQAAVRRDDGIQYTRDDFCIYDPKPNIAIFRADEAISREARSAREGSLTVKFDHHASSTEIGWFLSLIPRNVRNRIGNIKLDFNYPWDYGDLDYEPADQDADLLKPWLTHMQCLKIKEIIISVEMGVEIGEYGIEGTAPEWFENWHFHWRGDVAREIVTALLAGKVERIVVELNDAEEQIWFRHEYRASVLKLFCFQEVATKEIEQIHVDILGPIYSFTKSLEKEDTEVEEWDDD